MSVRIGHRGDRWFELGAWHALAGEALRFEDSARALLFLREQAEAGDIRRLRALLTRDNAMTQRLDDAVVLRLVAHRLHTRTLKAVAWHDRRFSFVDATLQWQPTRVEVPAAPPRSPLEFTAAPEPPPPAPPTSFEQPQAQAQALRAAASAGAPFCAVCQPPAARPHPPEPPRPELALAGAPEAQAQALQAAARTGAPFCAVCQPPPPPAPTKPSTRRPSPAPQSSLAPAPQSASSSPQSPPAPSPQSASSSPQSPLAPSPQSSLAPPSAPTLPADSDPVAQAQALRTAAGVGAPFCAVCQRSSGAPPSGPHS